MGKQLVHKILGRLLVAYNMLGIAADMTVPGGY